MSPKKYIKQSIASSHDEIQEINFFGILSDEIIIYIFSFLTNRFINDSTAGNGIHRVSDLDISMLSSLQFVNKRFNRLATDNLLWKTLFPCSVQRKESASSQAGWYNAAINDLSFLKYINDAENYPAVDAEHIYPELPNFGFVVTENKALVLLRLGLLSLEHTPNAWKGDTNIVRQAVNAFGCNLKYAAADLKSDRETVLIALNNDGNAFEHISEDLRNNKELFLLANDTFRSFEPSFGHILQFASLQLKDEYDIALVAIESTGLAYRDISDRLKHKEELLYKSMDNNAFALDHVLAFAPEEFRNNRNIALYSVKHQGESLSCLPDHFKNDREIVIAATLQNAQAIDHIGDDLREDRSIIINALRCQTNKEECHGDGLLENISPIFKDDPEVVLAAIKHKKAGEIKFASERLLADTSFLLSAYRIDNKINQYLTATSYNQLKNAIISHNKNIVLQNVSNNGHYLQQFSDYNDDKDVVLASVKQNGCALQYASATLRSNIEIVHTAVRQSANAVKFAALDLLNDITFILSLVEVKFEALYSLPQSIKEDIMYTPEKRSTLSERIMRSQGRSTVSAPSLLASMDWDGHEQLESIARKL